ncbi:mechanosensitive ion channel family protein [Alysiella filiformis]|uniref:Mechanosensitive ion channel n=1 Tax=Alysiella filiformis DSM 16848 TaxID=1120981 RepID=A0A286EGR3_9NEIS|nr:mechanosensitive ion channel family protein [Alysiella filiformis]QMT32455.1 mechanosensitive ion channel family protein [Alysiella filiformis]UBQ57317.1 mechanosensitive ion channel family protein [Alysiella filiformis DSM 16848]SOD70112.1 Mechanosensitive ion channel [Alysiella filiformis DSM 16848]
MISETHIFDYFSQHSQWFYSLLIIVGAVLGRSLWLRAHLHHHNDWELEQKRRFLVMSRNVMLAMMILGLFSVWATQIQHLALSMMAVAAALVLALKELLMCLSGSLLRAVTKQYSVGDFIEINHIRGRVVDINLLNTLVMQIGSHSLIGRLSGKTVSFPNSLLLSAPLYRDNILGHYVVHLFEIPVPIHLDSDVIVPRLQAVLHRQTRRHTDEIADYFEVVQLQKLFITPAAEPHISRVPHDDKVYRLVVRFASPLAIRLSIQQDVIDEFMRIQYRLLNNLPLDDTATPPPANANTRPILANGFTLNHKI